MPKRKTIQDHSARSSAASKLANQLQRACVAALVALLVITPLIPSEAAATQGTGMVLVVLWLITLTAWDAAGMLRGAMILYWSWADVAVGCLVGACCLSALLPRTGSSPRYTLNMMWTWVGLGVGYWLVRQLARDFATRRMLLSVMTGLACSLALFAVFQYAYSLPQTRLAYEKDPAAVMDELGIDAPEGSRERTQFENRLAGTEPFATFALTNSLAGFVVAWLIVAIGLGVHFGQRRGLQSWDTWTCLGVTLLLAVCLLLTKSRSAWLAGAAGLVAMAYVTRGRGGPLRVSRMGAVVVAAGAVLAFLVFLGGGLDAGVLTEAPKSLRYRIEYWQASRAMIADYFWLGCGPGNFQQFYTTYKLPAASETVRDPHNFIVEIWATTGTFGLIALLAVVSLAGRQLLATPATSSGEPQRTMARAGLVGGLVGAAMAFPIGLLEGFPPDAFLMFVGLPVGAVVSLRLYRPHLDGDAPRWLFSLPLVVLLINLLAAGGIGFPAVAQSVWLLLALSLNHAAQADHAARVPRPAAIGATLLVLALVVACEITAYRPILERRAAEDEALALQQRGHSVRAEQALLTAAREDPWSHEPWQKLAMVRHYRWLATRDPHDYSQFRQAAAEALARCGHSSALNRQFGNLALTMYRLDPRPELLQDAVMFYEESVKLYPNSNILRAQLAWAYRVAGETGRSLAEADHAWELDHQNPHVEQALKNQTIHNRVDLITDPNQRVLMPADRNAEQLIENLRSSGDSQLRHS